MTYLPFLFLICDFKLIITQQFNLTWYLNNGQRCQTQNIKSMLIFKFN